MDNDGVYGYQGDYLRKGSGHIGVLIKLDARSFREERRSQSVASAPLKLLPVQQQPLKLDRLLTNEGESLWSSGAHSNRSNQTDSSRSL